MEIFKSVVLPLFKEGYPMLPSGGGDAGKSPLLKTWKQFQAKLPAENTLHYWQSEKKPSLWGMATGKLSGVVVVDVDDADAMAVMGDLEPHVRTPRGGGHYYFHHPGYPVKTQAGILSKTDIRGDGGFINVVGKNPKNGGEYVVKKMPLRNALYPWDKMPSKILDAINHSDNKPQVKTETETPIVEGKRNGTLLSLAGTMIRRRFSQQAIESALLVENRARCQPPLEDSEVRKIAESACRYKTTDDKRLNDTDGYDSPIKIVTAAELGWMELPEMEWIMDGLLPVGFTLLAGKPKAGKSWLALETAYSLASGRDLFADLEFNELGPECNKGEALVLALEDNHLRLRERLAQLGIKGHFLESENGGLGWKGVLYRNPDGLYFTTQWPKIENGCIEKLESFLDEHPAVRLLLLMLFSE